MPEMTLLGWFHTILGILAVLSGFYTIYKYKVISSEVGSGKLYVLVTLLVAGSALGIYNQGGFGVAHVLAVLTLIALAGGYIMPAITDFLRRLPVGDPFIDSFEDPLLLNFHMAFLIIYVLGIIAQMIWLKRQAT
jgi:Mg/Co/Ni transporter MgtE